MRSCREKPRPRSEGILTKPFLFSVGIEGLVIAAATIAAFYLGLSLAEPLPVRPWPSLLCVSAACSTASAASPSIRCC